MFAFKVLFVFSVVAFVSASPLTDADEAAKKEMHANAEICKEEFHIEIPIKDIFRSDDEQPENVKCFLKCVFKKNEVLADGKIDREKFIHAVAVHSNEEHGIKIADACLDDAEITTCDDVAKFHICTVKKSKEMSDHEHCDEH